MPKSKTEIVNELITNGLAEADRTHLMSMSEQTLATLVKNAEEGEEKKVLNTMTAEEYLAAAPEHLNGKVVLANAIVKKDDELTDEEMKARNMAKLGATENAAKKPMTPDEYLASLPPGPVRDVVANSLALHSQERTRLIGVITANKSNVFTKEQLAEMPLPQLQGVAQLAYNAEANPAQQGAPVALYAGAGGGHVTQNAAPITQVPLVAPTMNFAPAK